MQSELILIDAYSQIFRAFFAIRSLSNSKGEPTNALYVFTRLLLKIQQDYPGDSGALLFDCGKPAFRTELAPQYKANRPPMPEELKVQMPSIRDMAAAFGWPLLSETNYEADDLIGAFAVHYPGPVRIVSGDKDLSQLIDSRVTMLVPAPKNGFEIRGEAECAAKFGVAPALIPDYLALVGDSSDNIPGVPGIGPKSAAALLAELGPIDSWLDHPETAAKSKFAAKLAGQVELLRVNLQLVRLKCELPARFADLPAVLRRTAPDWTKIRQLCEQAELKSILK